MVIRVLSLVCQDTKSPYQDVLESRFLADARRPCCFELEGNQYELDFVSMTQTNMRTGYKREVCRRPIFVSELDLMTGGLYVIIAFLLLMNTFIRQKQTIRTGMTDIYKERRKL